MRRQVKPREDVRFVAGLISRPASFLQEGFQLFDAGTYLEEVDVRPKRGAHVLNKEFPSAGYSGGTASCVNRSARGTGARQSISRRDKDGTELIWALGQWVVFQGPRAICQQLLTPPHGAETRFASGRKPAVEVSPILRHYPRPPCAGTPNRLLFVTF